MVNFNDEGDDCGEGIDLDIDFSDGCEVSWK